VTESVVTHVLSEPEFEPNTSASASASASAATTAAKSTLQVKSLSLATQACLAPAGTLDTCRSVTLCDSYDDN
jgi:hypothetical protein